MKVGIPVDGERVHATLDFAENVLISECKASKVVSTRPVHLDSPFPPLRVTQLTQCGVQLVICGGISNALLTMLIHCNIEVIPNVNGSLQEVMRAYLAGNFDKRRRIGGCCSHQRRRKRRRGFLS
ncbi:MAG: hypothetical protein GF398_02585 [Chitinivibrionales bacterium]|nr:hypothetical protein [Chitinivibrionales bacterium]